MKKFFLTTFALSLACSLPSIAGEKNAPASPGGRPAAHGPDVDKMIDKESRQPMDMQEPMTTGMAKPGMKKGDVKTNAMKKEAVMGERMKEEKMKR